MIVLKQLRLGPELMNDFADCWQVFGSQIQSEMSGRESWPRAAMQCPSNAGKTADRVYIFRDKVSRHAVYDTGFAFTKNDTGYRVGG